jgi:tRNA U34 5-methylaminomethyl-2-thiouridine-forming methyltransferase MnmC
MTTLEPKVLEMTEFGPLVETADGSLTIRHGDHGQDFHSSEGARFEAWELYVVASGYKDSLGAAGDRIRILDVGMGLAYNAAASIAAWLESDGKRSVSMVSLEIDPRLASVVASGAAPWFAGWSDPWLAGPRSFGEGLVAKICHPKSAMVFDWQILVGDGTLTLTTVVDAKFDFFWQDPFTPELNPSMWSGEWFSTLKDFASSEARLMTYSVSRVVKDALESGGWRQERFKTPGHKRHWLRASL